MSFSSSPYDQFLGSTAGVQGGLQQTALSQQMQQFLLALQFQQQQAALQQALNYGTQFGYAPGGNWMTWGQGGATQPSAGTPTLNAQQIMAALQQAGLGSAINIAGMTGQFAQPVPSQYSAGTILSAPSTDPSMGPSYGIVNQDGSVQMLAGDALAQTAAQRGTTAQALMQGAQTVDFNTLQRLSQGPPTGPSQQTQAAQQQQYNQALQSAQLTGSFVDPTQSESALLQQGKALNGQSFYSLPQDQQAFWLQYNQNNPQAAAQQWARGVNSALTANGYTNPAAAPQQTLQSINQAALLSGQYNGAPTEAAREYNQTYGLQQGQLTGTYNGAPTEAASEYARSLAEQQRQANMQNAIQQGQLGQQYLATAAQLQGPQNTFQLSNYLRGAQANANVPAYIAALQNNQGLAPFQAGGAQTPTPQSAGGLLAQMGGTPPQPGQWSGQYGTPSLGGYTKDPNAPSSAASGWTGSGAFTSGQYNPAMTPEQVQQGLAQNGGWGAPNPASLQVGRSPTASYGAPSYASATPGWDYDQTLNSIRGIAQTGAQSLAPGSLERLSPDELSAFGSGLGAAGYSMPSFLHQYAGSRVGQQAAMGPTSFGY